MGGAIYYFFVVKKELKKNGVGAVPQAYRNDSCRRKSHNSQFCVSCHFCTNQEARRRLSTIGRGDLGVQEIL